MKSSMLLALAILLSLSMYSCKDDDPATGSATCVNWSLSLAVQDELNAFSAAAQAYGTDPNTETCNAYKNAGTALINAYMAEEDCARASGQLEEYQMSLLEAEEGFAEIEC